MNDNGAARRLSPRGWALWSTPPAARAYVLLIDAAAVLAGVLTMLTHTHRPTVALVPLLVCAAVSVEGARRVERVRRFSGDLHKDLQSAWSLAAALILPAGVAVLAAVAMFAWWRLRAGRCRAFTWVFSSSMTVLAVLVAGSVFSGVRAAFGTGPVPVDLRLPLAALAAAVAYELVDLLLCGAAIRLMAPDASWAETFGNRTTAATDATALTIGGLVAVLAFTDRWAILLAVPAAMLLQRVLLVDQLAVEARTDAKTGLAVAGWWHARTDDELARARSRHSRLAVLVADLDHFKHINDAYGHLVGDEALRAVAGVVRSGIRGQDLSGRFGGEEFVVALPDTDADRAVLVAERLRERVAGLRIPSRRDDPTAERIAGLTVSIGVAMYPDHADTLDALLRAADRALYAAKATGRNRVELAYHPDVEEPATRAG